MSQGTSIEWTDATWNPVRGCSRVSEGCRNCYAERVAARFRGDGDPFHGFAYSDKAGPHWTGTVELIHEKLDEPLRRRRWAEKFARELGRRPRVFVNSMSDLFHERLSNEAIAAVFGVMAAAPWIDFQVLTKRPERMLAWFRWAVSDEDGFGIDKILYAAAHELGDGSFADEERQVDRLRETSGTVADDVPWPLPNVWLGVSVDDQETADERIQLLRQTPAALRFVSYEPALGPVDFRGLIQRRCMLGHPFPFQCRRPDHDTRMIDWLIVGGESGPGARPFDLAWARSAVAQCRVAGVPVFVKQLGAVVTHGDPEMADDGEGFWPTGTRIDGGSPPRVRLRHRKGGDPSEWPEDLRVREFPESSAA